MYLKLKPYYRKKQVRYNRPTDKVSILKVAYSFDNLAISVSSSSSQINSTLYLP